MIELRRGRQCERGEGGIRKTRGGSNLGAIRNGEQEGGPGCEANAGLVCSAPLAVSSPSLSRSLSLSQLYAVW
jgi:hypothetical protein